MVLSPQPGWRDRHLMTGFPPNPAERVTRDNWNRFPQSIWAFQHARQLFRSSGVARSQNPRALPVALADLESLRILGPVGMGMSWRDYLEATHTDAVVVLHRGVIVEERYGRDMTPATPHMVFSITKSIVGLLAEILAAEGAIDLSGLVDHHVPELATSAFAGASIRDLLDMVDGAAFDETYSNPDAEIHTWSPAYWGPKTGQPPSAGVYEALIGLTRRAAPPGSRFAYRTPVGDVIGWVLKRATGQALSELIATRLWAPIGAEHDAYLIVDSAGQEIAATGFNATARDLARLALMLLEDGKVGGQSIVPSGALASLRQGGDRALFAAADQPTRPGWSYRSLWWHTHNANGAYCALGVYGQRLFIDPTHQLAVVRLGSHPDAGSAPTDSLHAAAFEALVKVLA